LDQVSYAAPTGNYIVYIGEYPYREQHEGRYDMVVGYNKRPAAIDPFHQHPRQRRWRTVAKILFVMVIVVVILYVVF